MNAGKRGAFIVFEGCDRSGKSTQSRLLMEFLKTKNIPAKHMCFPARESNIGQVINSYLSNSKDLPDEVIHLLFSANRWEYTNEIKKHLFAGTTLVVDRYSYSGVAYTVAKGLSFDWCYAPERGLVRPDAVFYLKAAPDALTARGDYGTERYEKCEFQRKVADVFDSICSKESSYWHPLDATQPAAEVHSKICNTIEDVLTQVESKSLDMLK